MYILIKAKYGDHLNQSTCENFVISSSKEKLDTIKAELDKEQQLKIKRLLQFNEELQNIKNNWLDKNKPILFLYSLYWKRYDQFVSEQLENLFLKYNCSGKELYDTNNSYKIIEVKEI
jgi:hypothetical protein